MCLNVSETNEKAFIKKYAKKPQTRIKVYKLVKMKDDRLITPYMSAEIKSGWFKANETSVSLLKDKSARYGEINEYGETLSFDEGIHAFQNWEDAEDEREEGHEILECEMVAGDVIGIGDTDIVANKMWVPVSEVKKVLNKVTFENLPLGKKFKITDDWTELTYGVVYMKIEGCYGDQEALDMKSYITYSVDDSFDKEVKIVK